MSIPSVNNLLKPVLKLAGERVEVSTTEMWDQISSEFSLTPDELAEKMKNGTPVIRNRVAWAIVHLELAGILNLVNKGTYRITARGVSLHATSPQKLTIKALHDLFGIPENNKRQTSLDAAQNALRNAEIVCISPV